MWFKAKAAGVNTTQGRGTRTKARNTARGTPRTVPASRAGLVDDPIEGEDDHMYGPSHFGPASTSTASSVPTPAPVSVYRPQGNNQPSNVDDSGVSGEMRGECNEELKKIRRQVRYHILPPYCPSNQFNVTDLCGLGNDGRIGEYFDGRGIGYHGPRAPARCVFSVPPMMHVF